MGDANMHTINESALCARTPRNTNTFNNQYQCCCCKCNQRKISPSFNASRLFPPAATDFIHHHTADPLRLHKTVPQTQIPPQNLPSSPHTNMKRFLPLFPLFCAVLCSFLRSSVVCQQQESMVLLRDQLGVDADVWPDWMSVCNWPGVKCDERLQVVSVNVSTLPFSSLAAGQSSRNNASTQQNPFLPKLKHLNASGFPVTASAASMIQLLSGLETLDLRNSTLNGTMPHWLSRLANLSSLNLSFNNFSGILPGFLTRLSRLQSLKMSENLFVGSLPRGIGKVYNLRVLDLGGNNFSGPIPQELWNLSKLVSLDLSRNSISGGLGKGIGRLPSLRYLNLEHNHISGPIPKELQGCENLEVLKMDYNALSGNLPPEMGHLQKLQTMFLAFNFLTGTLPHEVTELRNLKILSLAFNRLFGNLPNGTGEMKALMLMDLRGNYFNGNVPGDLLWVARTGRNCFSNAARQHVQATCQVFYSSINSSSSSSSSSWASMAGRGQCKKDTSREAVKNMAGIMGGAVGGLVLVLAIGTVMICVQGRRSRSVAADGHHDDAAAVSDRIPSHVSFLGQSFSYDEILEATQKFDSSRLIRAGHSGEFYRGRLASGAQVAVKRIDLSSIKPELYVQELEVLGRANHSGLVPLLGHCLQLADEKFLVYRYVPNGDLESLMRWKIMPGSRDMLVHPLDWIARMKIAIGIADVLAYLHHCCSPPIVHRDIKASSILLDDKFEVRLSSLSSAVTASADPYPGLVARLLSISHSSWDQAGGDGSSSSSSVAYDVYCFGKVLLEIISGKVEIESEPAWMDNALGLINIHDKDALPRIVDPYLIVQEDLLEEVWAVAIIAKACLNPRASKRPNMQHVVKALQNPTKIVRLDMLYNNNNNNNANGAGRTSSHSSWNEAFGSWRSSTASHSQRQHPLVLPGSLREEHLMRMSSSSNNNNSKGRSLRATTSANANNNTRPATEHSEDDAVEG